MNVSVLLSSGETDSWENVGCEMDLNLGGSLVVREDTESEEDSGRILAIYAPGMWMKAEFEHED